MPTLVHHRKQAKLYLKWHRERYYPVADAIGSLLPRFADWQALKKAFNR